MAYRTLKKRNERRKRLALLFVFSLFTSTASIAMNITFDSLQESQNWAVSNDTVMGGVSYSRATISDGQMKFEGILSLDNNGGFTSVWRRPQMPLIQSELPISITVEGDGRTYQLRLRMRDRWRISYTASFETEAGVQSTHTFQPSQFTPVWRGRVVRDAPILDFSNVNQIGFLLADKNEGEFTLVVEQISQLNRS